MIKADTILVSVAFVLLVITIVLAFLFVTQNIARFPLVFCGLLCCMFILWAIHGYLVRDVALTGSAGFGALMYIVILGTRIYNKVKAK
jgi:hypothetical protein